MPDFYYEPMFQLGADETEYRSLDSEGLVDKTAVGGREVLVIDPKALRLLAAEAVLDSLRDLADGAGEAGTPLRNRIEALRPRRYADPEIGVSWFSGD